MSWRLFHVMPTRAWDALRTSDAPLFAPPSLEREGFCHLSFPHQLEETLRLHFAGEESVVLLEVDRGALGRDLRLEVSRGGERFPHVHAPLPVEGFLRLWSLPRTSDGRLRPPVLGPTAAEDDPPGLVLAR